MVRLVTLLTAVTTALFFAAACASVPPTGAAGVRPNGSEAVPEWVISPPQADATYEYFVGSAGDPVGDVAAAEQNAVNSLIDEIVRFIGVRITTETTAEARASLESFETAVTQQVRQTGAARVSGFRVQDRYVERRDDAVTVHILVAYDRSDLLAEKARIEALFRERQEAVDRPEREARQAESAGALFTAVTRYVEAAAAATRSDIDNADVRFHNNIGAAQRITNTIRIEPINGRRSTVIGSRFSEPFRVRVIDSATGRPVRDVPLAVSYREMMPGGRLGVRTARLTSGEDGIAAFDHPPTTIVGSETLTVSLDTTGLLRQLDSVPRTHGSAVAALREALVNRRVLLRYEVVSLAREVPTGVIVLDADIVGNPIDSTTAAAGIVTALSRADFSVRTLPYDPSRLAAESREQLIGEWRERFGATVDRVIYGVVALDEFEESDGIIVRVSGTVYAVDLVTGDVLHTVTSFQRSRSATASGAINAAFRNLGIRMGEEFAAQLR